MRTALLAAAAVILANVSGVQALAQTEQEARNKAAIQTAFDAWSAGTGGPFDLLADSATWTITGHSDAAGTYATKAEFIERVIVPFNARLLSGIRPTIRELHVDGDTVIIFFDASGMATDGQPYANTYAWFMAFQGDRIVRVSAFYDSIKFNDLWRRVTPAAR